MSILKSSSSNLISIFLPSLRGGGAERVCLNLSKSFIELGYNVDLVLCKRTGPYLEEVPGNVNVIDLGKNRVLFSFWTLALYLRKAKPLCLLSAMDHSNIIAALASKLSFTDTRVILSVHSLLSYLSKQPDPRQRVIPKIARWFYPWADAIVAVSRGVAKDLGVIIKTSREKIHVIHNPVVTNEMLNKATEKVNHPWFQDSGTPVIVSAGRMSPEKDFQTLIKAFALARKKLSMRLIILGDGDERPLLRTLAQTLKVKDDVDFPGFVKNPYAYMSKAAVFVLSSAWEGFGNVLVEAMALGTPVVSTDCPSGPSEILEHGRYGRLVPVGDAESLATAIIHTLRGPVPSEKLRKKAKEFSVNRIAHKYISILHDQI